MKGGGRRDGGRGLGKGAPLVMMHDSALLMRNNIYVAVLLSDRANTEDKQFPIQKQRINLAGQPAFK